MRTLGSPGTCEARSSPRVNQNEGDWLIKPLACSGSVRSLIRANERAREWYRQAKATKCGGMDDRESERLVLPMKLGNRPAGTQLREGGAGLRNV
jgi:hypothetical protein